MPLQKVTSALSMDKIIPRYLFNNIPSTETTFIRHSFALNGSWAVENEQGDKYTVNLPVLPASGLIELYEDQTAEIIAYRITYQVLAKLYTIWIYFDFKRDTFKVKITIQGELPTSGQFKLPFAYDSVNRVKVVKSGSVWFGSTNPYTGQLSSGVGFDWSDVLSGVSHDGVNNQIVISVSSSFTIDPSTVATSTTNGATLAAPQRKTFFAVTRYWVFFQDGSNWVFRSSTNGTDWGSSTTFCSYTAQMLSVVFDGTCVHVAYSTGWGGGGHLYYKRGTPASGGTISWDAEQIPGEHVTDWSYRWPIITIDSDGYPWIGYWYSYTPYEGDSRAWVTKSSTKDGTWTTVGGFPYKIYDYPYCGEVTIPVPLTSTKVYVIISPINSDHVMGKLWTGSWGLAEEVSSGHNLQDAAVGAVAVGDDVYMVYTEITSNDIHFRKRTYGSGWGTEGTVQAATTATTYPTLTVDSSNLYCFWAGSVTDHIYYKKYSGGSWDTDPTDWITETTDHLTGNDRLTCFVQSFNSVICLLYMTKTTSTYNVRYSILSIAAGWTHKLDGIANASISKIDGIAKTSISKVDGV